jgi:hypothetical protein
MGTHACHDMFVPSVRRDLKGEALRGPEFGTNVPPAGSFVGKRGAVPFSRQLACFGGDIHYGDHCMVGRC